MVEKKKPPAIEKRPSSIINSLGMELVPVEFGDRQFFIGRLEVTQKQFTTVMEFNPSRFNQSGKEHMKVLTIADHGELPVDSVRWYEASEFCDALSNVRAERLSGRVYRLPTSEEWEIASGNFENEGWFQSNAEGRTHYGGESKSNALGLFEMFGNVAEWCSDPVDKSEKPWSYAIRGGGISDTVENSSNKTAEIGVNSAGGIRVVMEIEDASKLIPTPDQIVACTEGTFVEELFWLEGHKGVVHSVAVSNDGKMIVSGGADGSFKLWETTQRSTPISFDDHEGPVMGVDISADGVLGVSGGEDGLIRVWNLKSKKLLRQFKAHQGTIHSVKISEARKEILSGGADKKMCRWKITGELIADFAHDSPIVDVAFSVEPGRAISSTEAGDVKHWDLSTGAELGNRVDTLLDCFPGSGIYFPPGNGFSFTHAFKPLPNNFDHFFFLPDSNLLILEHAEVLSLFDTSGRRKSFAFFPGIITSMSGYRGDESFVAGFANGRMLIGRVKFDSVVDPVLFSARREKHLIMSPSRKLGAIRNDNLVQIEIWDLEKFTKLWTMTAPRKWLFSNRDDRILEIVNDEQGETDLVVWDAMTGQEIERFEQDLPGLIAVDQNHVLTSAPSDAQMLRAQYFDLETKEMRFEEQFGPGTSNLVFKVTKNDIKAMGSDVDKIFVWSLKKKRHDFLHPKRIGKYEISNSRNLEISHSGTRLLATKFIFDIATQKLINVISLTNQPYYYGSVHLSSISADGKFVAYCRGNGQIHLWDIENERRVSTIHVRGLGFQKIGLLSNNRQVVVVDTANTVRTIAFPIED